MIESERIFPSQSDLTSTIVDTNTGKGGGVKNDGTSTVYSSFKDH